MAQPSQRPATENVWKPEAEITIFELLMMDGMSPETCWVIKKHWNNKFYYTVASRWFFQWILYYDAQIHEHQELNVGEFCWKSLALLYWMFSYYRHAIRFSTTRWILGIILLPSLSKFRLLQDTMCWRPYGWTIISSGIGAIPLSELSPKFSKHIVH
jgi:hypothetical protein